MFFFGEGGRNYGTLCGGKVVYIHFLPYSSQVSEYF